MNNKKLTVAFVGCGRFAKHFVPLFKAHPEVEKVFVCDLIPERAQKYSEVFEVPIIESFEDAMKSEEINAVAIFTQRFSHGPLVIEALKNGKHVYSAVPCSISIDEIKEIARLVEETGLTYSMGETGYYRTAAIFCREKFASGEMGEFTYGEAQYNHDIRNMEGSFKSSGGDDWKKFAGIPPFFYPTHSTSMILSCLPGVYAKKVCGFGYKSVTDTDIYGTEGQNFYGNPFGNETLVAELSNGGVMRISENRNIGWKCPETFITQFNGTDGCYSFAVAKHFFSHWNPECNTKVIMKDVSKMLLPEGVMDALEKDYEDGLQQIADSAGFFDMSPIQDASRLPESFRNLRNGHNGTHHFIVDDFCKAAATGKLSPTNIWEVARYSMPGLVAHESAMQGGVIMEVPDLGNPPEKFEMLDPYAFEYNQGNTK